MYIFIKFILYTNNKYNTFIIQYKEQIDCVNKLTLIHKGFFLKLISIFSQTENHLMF